jgi:hypothetical protein
MTFCLRRSAVSLLIAWWATEIWMTLQEMYLPGGSVTILKALLP